MDNSELIVDLLSQMQRGISQRRDGESIFSESSVEEMLNQIVDRKFEALDKAAGEVKSNNQIKKDLNDFQKKLEESLKNAGKSESEAIAEAQKARDEYSKKLHEINEEAKNNLKEFNKRFENTIDAFNKGLDNKAKREVANTISGGRSTKIEAQGKSIVNFGKALNRIGEKGGILSKAGVGIAKVGTLMKSLSGKLGGAMAGFDLAITALETFGNVLNKINEVEIKQTNFESSLYATDVERRNQELSLSNELNKENLSYFYELQKRNLQVEIEISKAAKQLSAENYAKAVQISVGSITDGIAQTAYQSAAAAIDAGATYLNNVARAGTSRIKEESTNKARGVSHESVLENVEQKRTTAQISYDNKTEATKQERAYYNYMHQGSTIYANATKGQGSLFAPQVVDDPSSQNERNELYVSRHGEGNPGIIDYSNGIVFGLNGLLTDFLHNIDGTKGELDRRKADSDFIRQQKLSEQELTKTRISNENEITNLKASNEAEIYNTRRDYEQSIYEIEVNTAKQISKTYLDLAYKQFTAFQEYDKAIIETGISVGIINRGDSKKYFGMMANRMPNILRDWGKSFEDVLKMQQGYSNSTGRSINLSNKDIENSFGLSILTQDQAVTDELIADMQIFNMSVADSSQMFGEVLDEARMLGLSTKKTGKDLVRDMKLANKYEFKGAKKALAEMSVWASKVRFDMGDLPSLIEKQTDSLESVITNSAAIQVLGGNFASQMGNPLTNAFLGFTDPAQLAKNQNEALRGIGYFDSKSGITKIGIADQQRLKAYSDATGISMENLRKQVFQMVQGGMVEDALSTDNREKYTSKQIELLQQQAHYKDGEWMVTLRNGEEKNINDISEEEFSDLLPIEEGMFNLAKEGVGYLKTMVDTKSKLEGESNAEKLELMQQNLDNYYKTYQGMLEQAKTQFENAKADFKTNVGQYLGLMVEAYKGYCETAAEGNKEIDEKRQDIIKAASDISATLSEANEMLKTSLAKMNGGGEAPSTSQVSIEEYKNKKNEKSFNWNKVWEMTAIGATTGAFLAPESLGTSILAGAGAGLASGLASAALEYFSDNTIDDGIVYQNGRITKIDSNDQVLAAKKDGPIDKMLDIAQPRTMAWDSFVRERPYGGNGVNGDKIEISPIQINLNGSIQLNGGNGSIDITQQLSKDPNFIRSLTQMISIEVEKKHNGGRATNILNSSLENY